MGPGPFCLPGSGPASPTGEHRSGGPGRSLGLAPPSSASLRSSACLGLLVCKTGVTAPGAAAGPGPAPRRGTFPRQPASPPLPDHRRPHKDPPPRPGSARPSFPPEAPGHPQPPQSGLPRLRTEGLRGPGGPAANQAPPPQEPESVPVPGSGAQDARGGLSRPFPPPNTETRRVAGPPAPDAAPANWERGGKDQRAPPVTTRPGRTASSPSWSQFWARRAKPLCPPPSPCRHGPELAARPDAAPIAGISRSLPDEHTPGMPGRGQAAKVPLPPQARRPRSSSWADSSPPSLIHHPDQRGNKEPLLSRSRGPRAEDTGQWRSPSSCPVGETRNPREVAGARWHLGRVPEEPPQG
ncbi:basic salivary proline-rich protein 1-like [Antechinus flavipes]|uniref:basic salivary proline-rich protein 1-like n=1 Tax=Antechinus flavipes TaxID=38775 RepID=UPI00223545A8|nr:basic salivary proline-rich protein 1-like [Antechinus flavipes]